MRALVSSQRCQGGPRWTAQRPAASSAPPLGSARATGPATSSSPATSPGKWRRAAFRRALAAEEALRGRPATRESFLAAADAELAGAQPLRDNAYKIALIRNLTASVLEGLA